MQDLLALVYGNCEDFIFIAHIYGHFNMFFYITFCNVSLCRIIRLYTCQIEQRACDVNKSTPLTFALHPLPTHLTCDLAPILQSIPDDIKQLALEQEAMWWNHHNEQSHLRTTMANGFNVLTQ